MNDRTDHASDVPTPAGAAVAVPGGSAPGLALQDVISIGYLYLLAVGIVSDSIFYGYFGVDILAYSDVLDVLLSPLTAFEQQRLFAGIVLLVLLVTPLFTALSLRRLQREAASTAPARVDVHARIASSRRRLLLLRWLLPAVTLFAAYIGFALGRGASLSEGMRRGRLRMSHRLTFADGDVATVRIIGSNSGYVFYVRDGNRHLTVTPLQDHVKAIDPHLP